MNSEHVLLITRVYLLVFNLIKLFKRFSSSGYKTSSKLMFHKRHRPKLNHYLFYKSGFFSTSPLLNTFLFDLNYFLNF